MNHIELRLEIQDHYGSTVKAFSKGIESPHTPSKGMVFTGEDYSLEARNIYFDLDDGTILIRFVETPSEDEVNGWDFLVKEGWTEL